MKLVEDWKQCWKWFSVQGAALIAIAPEAYQQVQGMQAYVSPGLFNHAMAVLGVLVIVGRVIEQEKKDVQPK